jgi:lysine biosynthesis protein LysW
MKKANCPECDAVIVFTLPPNLRDRVRCKHCGSTLKVIRLSPLTLDWAFLEPIEGSVHGNDGRYSSGIS